MNTAHIDDLNNRLGNIIRDYCNKLGCGNCGLEWPGSCSALDLQSRILELEYPKDKDEL